MSGSARDLSSCLGLVEHLGPSGSFSKWEHVVDDWEITSQVSKNNNSVEFSNLRNGGLMIYSIENMNYYLRPQ